MLRASRVTQHAVTHAVDTLRISSRLTARSAAAGGGRAGGIGATSAIRAAAIHQSRMGPAGSMDNASGDTGWVSLRTPRTELVLNHTLPTGQSFRWRLNTDGDYVGVIGKRVVSMRQATDDVLYRVHCRPNGEDATHDAAALADYFNLSVSLASLVGGMGESGRAVRQVGAPSARVPNAAARSRRVPLLVHMLQQQPHIAHTRHGRTTVRGVRYQAGVP
jgi:N-glycosylase/DNA lyase